MYIDDRTLEIIIETIYDLTPWEYLNKLISVNESEDKG